MALNNWKQQIKKAGKSGINSIFEFLMRQAKTHKGRTLYDARELKLVRESLLTQNLFGMDGYMVSSFEKEFAKEYGVPYGVASTSGTAAIHTALGALDLNAGDEVITAPITDLGTIIPILYQNAIPVFADIDATYNMDPADVEKKITLRTKAILVVHLFGNTCDMDAMMAVAKKHNIPVIEDCSQAHMTEYKGKFVGTIGDIGCFSFQQSKHMTTGDGGMTITSNKNYYERMKLFVDKGYARKGWGTRAYLFHAPNYRMNEITAAVGRAQLKKVKAVIERRHEMGEKMTKLLSSIDGLTVAPVTPGAHHSYWLYPFKIEGVPLEPLCKEMINHGFYAMAGYTGKTIYLCSESLTSKKTYGNSELPFSWNKEVNYEYKEGLCPRAEKSLETLVCMPWHECWKDAQIEKAAEIIKKAVEKLSHKKAKEPISIKEKPPVPASVSSASKKKTRVGLIGCGQIGSWHLEAYQKNPDVEVAAVVDTDFDRAEKFAAQIKAKAYRSHKEMIQNEKLDGVSLCTVPSTHRDITLDLLDAGIHVLCEKPLAVSVMQAEEMFKKAKEKNRLLLTAFKLRFSEEILKAKELIDKKTLGELLTFRLIFGGYMEMAGTWYARKEISGGGVIMDNGPHAIDLVQYLLGNITNVSASASDFKNLGVEDTAKLNLSLANGVSGTIDISWLAYVTPQAYLEIYGNQGACFLDMAGISYKLNTWAEWKRISNKTDVSGGFARQIDHFVNSIRTGKTTVVDNEAGLRSQKVIEAVYNSIQKDSKISVS